MATGYSEQLQSERARFEQIAGHKIRIVKRLYRENGDQNRDLIELVLMLEEDDCKDLVSRFGYRKNGGRGWVKPVHPGYSYPRYHLKCEKTDRIGKQPPRAQRRLLVGRGGESIAHYVAAMDAYF